MKEYTVKISNEALTDMEELYHYIAYHLQSPEYAMGQYNRIADQIMTLSSMPKRIRIMNTEPEQTRKIRRLMIDNYSVFYTIQDECVIVLSVLYSASDIEKRLQK